MREEGGIGFSAIQMGFPYRIFMMQRDDKVQTFYNPEILLTGDEPTIYEEGCLSFPGLRLKIKRPDEIKVRYQCSEGRFREEDLTGILSRCYQHELDHLDGICFTDKVSKLALDIARRKRAKSERK